MIDADASPNVGKLLNKNTGNRGVHDALLLHKESSGSSSNENYYRVLCYWPSSTLPFVIWRMVANEQKWDVGSGSYFSSIIEAVREFE